MKTTKLIRILLAGAALAPLVLTTPVLAEGSGIMLTPDEVKWIPNPRIPGLEIANIIGDSTKPGAYVQRVKFPKGRVVQAHSHPDERTYTVLSGTWYVGWGDKFDAGKLKALPPGSFYTEPAGVPHFVATPDGEAIVQSTGTGPTAVHYVEGGPK